jgi:hypothetical protein
MTESERLALVEHITANYRLTFRGKRTPWDGLDADGIAAMDKAWAEHFRHTDSTTLLEAVRRWQNGPNSDRCPVLNDLVLLVQEVARERARADVANRDPARTCDGTGWIAVKAGTVIPCPSCNEVGVALSRDDFAWQRWHEGMAPNVALRMSQDDFADRFLPLPRPCEQGHQYVPPFAEGLDTARKEYDALHRHSKRRKTNIFDRLLQRSTVAARPRADDF